jgi:acylphosphatase
MTEEAHLSAKVYGRVQGVFFRYFVKDLAKSLGLVGYVRNLPSGDAVEVEAEGDKQKLEELLKQLKIGPKGAWVERIEANWSNHSGRFTEFNIRFDPWSK